MASWNGQLSACQFRLLNLSPCPRPRPHDSDPVLTVTQPPPWPPAAPHPDARPLTLPPSEILDRELQEAFQECEEQMASLGIFNSTESRCVVPQMVPDIQEKTREEMVNKANASSSQPPVAVQPEHSSGGHGNKHTHGNSEAANSQKDTVVFSFRNYILGTGSSTGAPVIETGIKVTENLGKCPEIEPEKEKEIDEQKDTTLEASDSLKETQTDAPITGQIDNQRQEHTDSDAVSGEKANLAIKTVIKEEVTETITEILGSKEEHSSDAATISICIAENGSKGDSVQECIHLHVKDTGALSETQTGANNHTEEEPKTHIWKNSLSDKEVEPDKKAKKKEKRKKRKKKKMEKNTETVQEVRETVQQPESGSQAVPLLDAGNHTDSEANMQSVSQAGSQAVICVAQPNNGSEYEQQLSPGGTPSFTPPPSSSPSRQDHLTYSACSPVSSQAHQSCSCTHTDTPCGMNHCSEQHAAAAMTYVQPTVVRPSASADKTSDAETQEAIVTSAAAVLTQESQSTLFNSQNCVGESALEEVLVPVAALPLTTPTMPEVIESKGEGERVRRDTLKREATVAIAESEKAAGEQDLCLSYVDGGKERLLDSLPQLSLISPGKCTLAFSAAEGQTESQESCSSKMPHNSVETETKGQRETSIYSSDTEVSSAEEGAKEKEALCLEVSIDTSPHGVLAGPDRQDDRAVRLEGAGVGGGAEAIEKKGGRTREHSSLSQPEGSAGGVSSAQTETCPPTDVAESPLKPHCWRELIPAITDSLCTEKLRLSEPSQEQHAAASSPLHTHPEQSLSNTNGGVRADLKPNLVPEEALSLGHICQEPSITETEKNYSQVFPFSISPQPPTAPQQLAVDRQASNSQQVQSESSTVDTRTAEGASEFQALTQIDRGSPVMSGGGLHVCNSSGRSNKVHFADTVKQEGSSSVDLRNMALLAPDCASLPPLTVHESLHHPVVEVSYTFPDFLSLKKPERPTNAVLPKDEAVIGTSADLTKPQKDVQLDKGDSEFKDGNDNLNLGQSGHKNSETDNSLVTVAHPKPSQKGNDECSESAVFPAGHQTAGATKQLEAEAEKGRVTGAELHAESEQLPEVPLVSDATVILEEKEGKQHLLSPSCSALPADDVASEMPNEQLSTDLHSSSKPQTVTLTCTVSESIDPSCQLDETPSCGLVTPQLMMAAHDSADLPKEESASEMAASDQQVPVTEQRTSNAAFVPPRPGPMLSHLESIADSDVLPPEQTDNNAADGCSTKMHRENSREVTQTSLAQDAKHSEAQPDKLCPKMEDRNIVVDNSVMNSVNFQFSQEENVSPAAVGGLAGSDQVISQSPTEPDSTGIKPVICDSPTKDELINVSCPLSAALPTCQGNDEIRRDGLTEKHKIEDDTYLLCEAEKKQAEEPTVDNQKDTDRKLQSRKSAATPQQSNGPGKEAVKEIRDLQPSHKHRDSESPLKDLEVEGSEKESGIASKSNSEACLLSADRAAGLPAEVQPGREPQTGYEGSCRAEHGSDTDAAQSAALGQSQSTPDPDCFAQQQDQQQRFLGSRHPPEELPGGCLEEGGETKSQVRQIQALALGVNGTTEEMDSSAGSVGQVIPVEKAEAEGGQAAPGVGGVDLSTHPASSLNASGNATADRDGVTTCPLVGDTRQEIGENKRPGLRVGGSAPDVVSDAEFLSDRGDEGQQKSNLSVACQKQHRMPGTSTNTAASVESASQEHETSPLPTSVTSEVSTESNDRLTDVWVNRAEDIHRELSSTPPDPVRQPGTVENDSSAANAVKSNSRETEECEIQHTVCEPLKLQSPSIPSATQSSDGAKTAIKGPGVEIPQEDKAALVKEKVCSQGMGQNEIKAKKTEGRDKEEVVNPSGSVEDDGFGSLKVSDLCDSGVSLHGTEADTGRSERATGPSSVTESGSDGTDKTSPEVVTVPSVASSNRIEKLAPPPPAAPTQSEQPHDQVSSPKPKDDVVSNSAGAAPQSERRSPEKAPPCSSPVHQQCVNAETGNVSESPAPGIPAQEPNTNWIKALREAASQSESKQESTVDTRR